MTIDEAIVHEKNVSETNRFRLKLCAMTMKERAECEKAVEEHKQIAEWLEELKAYRAPIFSGDMTQAMLKEERNKAIDDFAEKLNAKCDAMIKEKWNSNVAPISWAEAYSDFKDDIDEIAEQLKAGEIYD